MLLNSARGNYRTTTENMMRAFDKLHMRRPDVLSEDADHEDRHHPLVLRHSIEDGWLDPLCLPPAAPKPKQARAHSRLDAAKLISKRLSPRVGREIDCQAAKGH